MGHGGTAIIPSPYLEVVFAQALVVACQEEACLVEERQAHPRHSDLGTSHHLGTAGEGLHKKSIKGIAPEQQRPCSAMLYCLAPSLTS